MDIPVEADIPVGEDIPVGADIPAEVDILVEARIPVELRKDLVAGILADLGTDEAQLRLRRKKVALDQGLFVHPLLTLLVFRSAMRKYENNRRRKRSRDEFLVKLNTMQQ